LPWDGNVAATYEATFDGYNLRVEENPSALGPTLSYARGIVLYTPGGDRYARAWDASTTLLKDDHGIQIRARLDPSIPGGAPVDLDARFFCN